MTQITLRASPTESDALRAWLRKAVRGQWHCYWHGYLSIDREYPPRTLPVDIGWRYAEQADEVGRVAWSAYKRGRVLLFQKRNALYGWQYLAIKL